MRYGACIGTNFEKLEKLAQFGYDYAEINLSAIADWEEARIEEVRREMERTGIWAEACNGFYSALPEGALTDEKADFAALEEYVRRALGKAVRLGVKTAAVGSGKARMILDESRRKEGMAQYEKALLLAARVGAECGVTMAVEPLGPQECNTVNTVSEGLALCRRLSHPNLFVMGDFFHMFMAGEDPEILCRGAGLLRHLHIARANADRLMPVFPEDEKTVQKWAAVVKKSGYNGRISLEGGMGDDWDETARKMRKVLQLFE